jgi:hypothetical protein
MLVAILHPSLIVDAGAMQGQTIDSPFASVDDYGRRLRITIVRGHTGGIVDYDYEQDYDYDLLAAIMRWGYIVLSSRAQDLGSRSFKRKQS